MPTVCFIVVEAAFLALAHLLGGPPWTVVGGVAILTLMLGGIRTGSLALMVPGLVWLVLSHVTGNRELFFPYSMYLASCVMVSVAERASLLGPIAGGLVVAVFMAIRILQQATIRVLAVELAVAAAILTLAIAARSWSRRHDGWDLAIVAASSLLAYASLAL